jgi:hypothetical protein
VNFEEREKWMKTVLKELKIESDAKPLLIERGESVDAIDLVIILELHRDGTQHLYASSGTMHQKAFLKAFFDSWMGKWFSHEKKD